MSVGTRVKKRRIELGLSVDELAEKIKKSRATVYRYESDEIENLSITILEPLAKALDTTPTYLMGWDENELQATKDDLKSIDNTDLKLHQKLLKIKPFSDVKDAMRFVIKYNLKVTNSKGLDELNDEEILEFVNTTLRNTQEVIKATLKK